MAFKHTNRIKATIWGRNIRMDFDGDIASGIEMAFYEVRGLARAKLLVKLMEIDRRLAEREAEAAAQKEAA